MNKVISSVVANPVANIEGILGNFAKNDAFMSRLM